MCSYEYKSFKKFQIQTLYVSNLAVACALSLRSASSRRGGWKMLATAINLITVVEAIVEAMGLRAAELAGR